METKVKLGGVLRDMRPLRPDCLPKLCAKCGVSFGTIAEFVAGTDGFPDSSGLMDVTTKTGESYLALMRNCRCGTTLAVLCADQRDRSAPGTARRMQFGEMLEILSKHGLSKEAARAELLRTIGVSDLG